MNAIQPGSLSASLESLLDAGALLRLRQLDPRGESALLERVLDAFRESLARFCVSLREARHAGDAAALRHVVHTLKSSSASVGATRLAQLCIETETLVRQGHIAGGAQLLDALEAELQRVHVALVADAAERCR